MSADVGITTPGLLLLELLSAILPLYLLVVVGTEMSARTATPMDGLSVSTTSLATLIGSFRSCVLVGDVTSSQRRSLQATSSGIFILSGYYLMILWATLYIGLTLARPPQSYVFVVSRDW